MLIHGWNKVKLSLTNHAAGGLTEIDFDMAARFDVLLGHEQPRSHWMTDPERSPNLQRWPPVGGGVS